MRVVTAVLPWVVFVSLAGCTSNAASTASPAVPTDVAPSEEHLDGEGVPPVADENGLIRAQYSACDLGKEILRYLATGDNGGDPGMDRVFAQYVGVPVPQARALADEWIVACDEQYAEQESAEISAAAEASARASASAASAAASASRAQHNAAVAAEEKRSCAAIGGQARDGICESTSPGHVTGDPYYPCSALVVRLSRVS
ncbi:hypothetical protein [Blastococcus saxobsidens]|uniref:Lipoprotein n=1 Tax=Blastococcus saxobsidens (strain DD2) TaxID=1146883 RepID=H6RKE4_BLASD|nr:hypothetical protein [Blastococcus saxobsidens]CCG02363.1 exported protein of unknown function [Blastococcus saxobsidens DD2]